MSETTQSPGTTARQRRIRPALVAEIRRRALKLKVTYPSAARVARLDNSALTTVTDVHRATLAVLANPGTPVAVLTSTLLDAHHAFEVYEQANSDDDGGSDDSDCIAACDQLAKDCMESWGEAFGQEDIDIFDGEEAEDDDGSGPIDLEDNPVDVENEDAGDTGGEDDSSDTHGENDGLTVWESVLVSGYCAIMVSSCIAACLIPG